MDVGDDLVHFAPQFSFLLARAPESNPEACAITPHDEQQQGHHCHHHQCKAPVNDQHDRNHSSHGQQVVGQAGAGRHHEILQGLNVAAESRHDIPTLLTAMKGEGKPLYVGKEIASYAENCVLSGADQQPVAPIPERGIGYSQHEHDYAEGVEKGQAMAERVRQEPPQPMRQRLLENDAVDDELERPWSERKHGSLRCHA